MAASVRRFNVSNPAANTRTRMYTVPAGRRAIVRRLTQGNDNGIDVRMGTVINGAGWIWDVVIKAGASREWELGTVLYEGQYIDAEHNSTGCYSMLEVVEMDAALEGRNLWQFHAIDFGAATRSYQVPGGKRVRVRQIDVCPHATTGHISLYISSVGHFFKRNPISANNPEAHRTDMSANPGEIIAAATGGPMTVHAFFSGVIEDA